MLVTVVIIITIIVVRVSDLRETKKQEKVLVSSSKRLEVYNERLKSIQKLVITQNEEIISQNILLQVNRDDLIRQHKKFISSLDYAHRIQQALVQSEKIVQKVFNQSFVLWLPLDVVSGDFYWIYEDKYKKYVVTADCTGHGVPGALVSMLGISMLNDISVKFSQLTTMDIMNMYRDAFRNSLQDNLVYDGMDLALYSIDKQTNVLQFTGAHRPLFLIRNHELTELKPDRMGINNTFITDKFQFTNQEIQLQEGDMIYTFSDGITDQLGGESGRNKFSMNQLRGLLKEISGLELSIQKSTINATITHWMSSFKTTSQTKQLDDILLIGVKI
jgi:serine phosphatase RsbU (regulator of sigma subunit)